MLMLNHNSSSGLSSWISILFFYSSISFATSPTTSWPEEGYIWPSNFSKILSGAIHLKSGRFCKASETTSDNSCQRLALRLLDHLQTWTFGTQYALHKSQNCIIFRPLWLYHIEWILVSWSSVAFSKIEDTRIVWIIHMMAGFKLKSSCCRVFVWCTFIVVTCTNRDLLFTVTFEVVEYFDTGVVESSVPEETSSWRHVGNGVLLQHYSVDCNVRVDDFRKLLIADSGLSKGVNHHFRSNYTFLLEILGNIIGSNRSHSSSQTDASYQPFCIFVFVVDHPDGFQ